MQIQTGLRRESERLILSNTGWVGGSVTLSRVVSRGRGGSTHYTGMLRKEPGARRVYETSWTGRNRGVQPIEACPAEKLLVGASNPITLGNEAGSAVEAGSRDEGSHHCQAVFASGGWHRIGIEALRLG